jgi:hypothetical protein
MFLLYIESSNKLAVDVKVEHSAAACSANSLLTTMLTAAFQAEGGLKPQKDR